eukprot:5736927-Pyramimonas_sp.AAC.1
MMGMDEGVKGRKTLSLFDTSSTSMKLADVDTGGDADPLDVLGTGICGWFRRRVFYLQIVTGLSCGLGCCGGPFPESLEKEITPETVGTYPPPRLTDYMAEFAALMAATFTESLTMCVAAFSIMETSDEDVQMWQAIPVIVMPLFSVMLFALVFSEMTSRRYLFYRCLEEMTLMDINNEQVWHSLIFYYLVASSGFVAYVSFDNKTYGLGVVIILRAFMLLKLLNTFYNMEVSRKGTANHGLINRVAYECTSYYYVQQLYIRATLACNVARPTGEKFVEDDECNIKKEKGKRARELIPHREWPAYAAALLSKMQCVEEKRVNEDNLGIRAALAWGWDHVLDMVSKEMLSDVRPEHKLQRQEFMDQLCKQYLKFRKEIGVDFSQIGSDERRQKIVDC